jgi:predicted ATPase
MAIKKIKVSNFKSFKELDLELGNFNVVIGANASGKSNFVQIFRFIRDIANMGLDNAISLQGSEYLTNIGISPPKLLSLKIIAASGEFGLRANASVIALIKEADYEFALKFKPTKAGFEIEKDFLSLGVNYAPFAKTKNGKQKEGKIIGSGKLIIRNEKGTPKFKLERPASVTLEVKDIYPPFIMEQKLNPKTLLLEAPFFFFPPIEIAFSDIAIYDFDPKLSKKAVPVAGKFELEEDGSNLSLVLKSIVENTDKRRKFSNLIKDLLPFVDDLATDKFADKSLLFKLREIYFKNIYFPASFISDGTVNISALLIALYFEQKSLSIIEEPERNIHPHLISKVMDMMKDASENKQIIVTTHSPEVVKHTDLENILLVSRDKEGFSTISRPGEKKEVKIFLKNEMGVDELYIQNLLGE